MSSPIAKIVKFYLTVVPSPLLHAGLIGLGSWWLTKKSIPMIQNAGIKSSLALTGKGLDQQALQQAQLIALQQRSSPMWQKHVPISAGVLLGLLSLAGNTNFNKLWNGWLSWNPADRLVKTEALKKTASLWLTANYQPSCNFNQVVDSSAVLDIFNTNPIIRDNSYIKNFGTSIVTAAPKVNYGSTTLGGIYDSAYNKFENKLTLHGIAKLGVKSLVAGSLAGLFTDTVGTVVGLPAAVKAPITKSVALGSALYSILT